MRKPSNLYYYVNNKISEYSTKILSSQNKQEETKNKEILAILVDIQKICQERKKY